MFLCVQLGMSLNDHKKLVDQEMFKVIGQFETASEVLDHLYLGSEWNAMDLEGLKELQLSLQLLACLLTVLV